MYHPHRCSRQILCRNIRHVCEFNKPYNADRMYSTYNADRILGWTNFSQARGEKTAFSKAEITLKQSHLQKSWYQLKSTVAGDDLVD